MIGLLIGLLIFVSIVAGGIGVWAVYVVLVRAMNEQTKALQAIYELNRQIVYLLEKRR